MSSDPDAKHVYTYKHTHDNQVIRLRFVPEGDEDDDVDIDFLKSVEEQIRTKLKVRLCLWVGWVGSRVE